MIDDGGNSNVVKFNMSEVRPRLTRGWYKLRECYDLQGTCTIWLHLMEDCVFNISIYNSDCKEISVLGAPLCDIYISDDEDFYIELPKFATSHILNDEPVILSQAESLSAYVQLKNEKELDGANDLEIHGVAASVKLKNEQEVDGANDQVINDAVAHVEFENAQNIDGANDQENDTNVEVGIEDEDLIDAEVEPVPVAPIPQPLQVCECVFTCTLTDYHATRSKLLSFYHY